MMKTSLLFITITIIILLGCSKEEGIGGNSAIKGKIMMKVYDVDYSVLQRTVPAADENVYIIYGNNDFISDKTTTNYDGSFSFEYLIPGNYKIICYTEDSILYPGLKKEIISEVTVGTSKTFDLDTIYLIKSVEFDKGFASVSGRILSVNYKKDFEGIIDTTAANDKEVYLVYGNHTTFDQRYRTSYNGKYEFKNLIAGRYTMYTYSEEKKLLNDKVYNITVPIVYRFSVNSKNQFLNEQNEVIASIPDIRIKFELK